jgi:GNAT superfamily N-acetyltransferase
MSDSTCTARTSADGVGDLAIRPFLHVHRPADWSVVSLPGADLVLRTPGIGNVAYAKPDLTDVPASIAVARQAVRHWPESKLVWSVPGEPGGLAAAFEREGLVSRETPFAGARMTAMALEVPPFGAAPDEVEVGPPASFAEVDAACDVLQEAFTLPSEVVRAVRRRAWRQEQDDRYPIRRLVARLGGVVVGTGQAAYSPYGLNMLGGCVRASARGRGVYRALIARRWQLAVERGTPALAVQAGPMSRPILERLGFRTVATLHTLCDDAVAGEDS